MIEFFLRKTEELQTWKEKETHSKTIFSLKYNMPQRPAILYAAFTSNIHLSGSHAPLGRMESDKPLRLRELVSWVDHVGNYRKVW